MNKQDDNDDRKTREIEVRHFDLEQELDIDFTIKAYAYLEDKGIEVKYLKKLPRQGIEVENLETIKIDFELRHIATGEYAEKRGLAEGTILDKVYFETIYNDEQIPKLEKMDIGQFEQMVEAARETFGLLIDYFSDFNMQLVSAKMWFAEDEFGNVYLASDITPKMVELWDKKTNLPFESEEKIYNKVLG